MRGLVVAYRFLVLCVFVSGVVCGVARVTVVCIRWSLFILVGDYGSRRLHVWTEYYPELRNVPVFPPFTQ